MLVVYNGNDVITVSYDRVLIIMTIQEGKVGEKVVSFEEHVIE